MITKLFYHRWGGAMGDKKFKRTKPQLDIPHLKKSAKGALM